MKNENGFGTLEFLALTPLLLSLLATVAGLSLLFKADSHLRHECRVSVLNSQRSAAEKLRALIAMNPQARSLREQHQQAQEELDASAGTPAAVVAAAHLAAVEAAQLIFRARQQALILQARATSLVAPQRAKFAVTKAVAQEASENKLALPPTKSSSRFGRFPLDAEPPGDTTPDYNPTANFSRDQVVDVEVTVDVASLLPEWLRKLLPTSGLQVSSHCQATIEKQEDAWVETLNAVK